jgi:hypothetical protein
MNSSFFVNYSQANYAGTPRRTHQRISRATKTPRPLNAFMLYRQEKQKELNITTRNLHSKELSKVIGTMWKNETKEVGDKFARMAEEEKVYHSQQHPDYKYSPVQKKKNAPSTAKKVQEHKHANQITDTTYNAIIETNQEEDSYGQIRMIEENFNTINIEQFLNYGIFDTIDYYSPSTPPSAVVRDLELIPGGPEADFMYGISFTAVIT